jgi:hypothetical protein
MGEGEASGQIFQIEGELFFLLIGYLHDDTSSPYGKSTVYNGISKKTCLTQLILILSVCNERKKLYIPTII